MKKLDASAVTDSIQMPIKKGTIKFLQDANAEVFAAMAKWMVLLKEAAYDNASTVYVLYGCVNSSTTVGDYAFSAGAVLFQDEIYLVDGPVSFTLTGSNIPIFKLDITNYTVDADPVTFTDNTNRNVHKIRKLKIDQGASGSGVANFPANVKYIGWVIPAPVNLIAGVGINVTGAYPDKTITAISNSLNPILASGSLLIGDGVGPGGNAFEIIFTNPLTTNKYFVMGSLRYQTGTGGANTNVVWTVTDTVADPISATGFKIYAAETFGANQALIFDWIVFAR